MPVQDVYIPKFGKNLVKFLVLGPHTSNPCIIDDVLLATPNYTPSVQHVAPVGPKCQNRPRNRTKYVSLYFVQC